MEQRNLTICRAFFISFMGRLRYRGRSFFVRFGGRLPVFLCPARGFWVTSVAIVERFLERSCGGQEQFPLRKFLTVLTGFHEVVMEKKKEGSGQKKGESDEPAP